MPAAAARDSPALPQAFASRLSNVDPIVHVARPFPDEGSHAAKQGSKPQNHPERAPGRCTRHERFPYRNATGYAPFLKARREWGAQGNVKALEHVIPDLADAPNALIGLLAGKNFGKVVVRVGPDELA